MIELIIPALYFMLPAYIANAFPVIGKHFNLLPQLAIPIDGDYIFHKNSLFGHSKTIRGFVLGVSGGILIGLIQYFLYNIEFIKNISLVNYDLSTSLILGFLLSFGTLLGDLIESFFKRRIGIKSGSPWVIADQIDYVIGALLLASPIIILEIPYIVVIFILSGILAFTANVFSYFIGIKKVWW